MVLEKMSIWKLLVEKKDIVCFGSGEYFDSFLAIFPEACSSLKIRYVVDGNPLKWGRTKVVGGKTIPIVSPEYFIGQDKKEIIALLTLKPKEEILNFYQNVEGCQEMRAVWSWDIIKDSQNARRRHTKNIDQELDDFLEKKTIQTIEELLEQQRDIVCFGNNKELDKTLEAFEDTSLCEQIRYIVDIDSAKWGMVKSVGNREIPIVSPNYFITLNKKNIIVLLAIGTMEDVLKNCLTAEEYEDIQVAYIRKIMKEYFTRRYDEVKVPVVLQKSDKMLIPKVIHYCWFGKGDIPYENRVWMESWEKYCPDYKIIQWNEDNYDVTKNQYMMEAYKARRWGFATDYARLDIIYQNGGVYLDTDVELVKSLDELLYQPAFMGWEDGLRVATGLGFGAVKGMKIIKEMRDYYDELHFVKEDGSHDLTACPTYQTKVLQRHGLKKNGEHQIIEDVTILPVTYLCGKPSYVLHDTRTEYTFGIHQFQGSWRKLWQPNENDLKK